MATPITWRNVDAPNFSGALDAQKLAATQISNATNGLSNGLSAFDAERRTDQDNLLAANASSYSNPDDLRAAIANGAIYNGVDKSLVSAPAIAAVNTQAGTLLNQAVSSEALKNAVATDPIRQHILQGQSDVDDATQAPRIAAAPLANQATQAQIDASRATTAATTQGTAFAGQLQPFKVQQAGNDVGLSGLKLNEGNYDFSQQQETAKGVQAASEAQRVAGDNPDAQRDYLEQQNLSAPARAAAQQALPAAYGAGVGTGAAPAISAAARGGSGGSVGGLAGGSAPILGGSAPSFTTALPTETQKYVPQVLSRAGGLNALPTYVPASGNAPSNSKDIAAALLPSLVTQESGGDPNAISPKGAAGLYGLMPATAASPGYNVTPQQNSSQAEQKRFSTDYLAAMIDHNGGDVQKGLAAYNAGPGAVDTAVAKTAALDPGQIQSTAQHLIGTAASIQRDIRQRQVQDLGSGIANQYAALTDPNAPVDPKTGLNGSMKTVADAQAALGAKGGQFAAVDPAELADTIQKVADQSGSNPAVAQALIERYGYQRTHNWITGELSSVLGLGGNTAHLKDDQLDAEINKIKDGTYDNVVSSQAQSSAVSNQISQAAQTYSAAKDSVLQLISRSSTVPGSSALLANAQQRLNTAAQLLQRATSQATNPNGSTKDQYKRVNTDSADAAASTAGGWENQTLGGPSMISAAVAPPAPPALPVSLNGIAMR